MKKTMVVALAALLLVGSLRGVEAAETSRGGFMGFIAGCCFGIRSGIAYNEGKDIHWREWGRLIPFAGFVLAIWDGVEGSKGMTTADYATQYGANYY